MILTVPAILAAGAVNALVGWFGFFRDAVQAVDCTLAIARLIERIRLADIRMATPPGMYRAGMLGLVMRWQVGFR